MLQVCDSLASGRRTIVSMPECTAFQVEIVFSNRMQMEISASYMFWGHGVLAGWFANVERVIDSFLQLEKWLTTSLVTFAVLDNGYV